jgi:tetratricopeptide (TPR) repeat protein
MFAILRALSIYVVVVLAGSALGAPTDYAARYTQLLDQKEYGQLEALLDEWRTQQPDDPDAWIKSADFYFNQALSPTISTKKPDGEDFVIAEKNGSVAGSLSFKPNQALVKKAASFLSEATRKFPNRLDIWCGLAYINQEGGDFDAEFAVLKQMTAYVHAHPRDLRWLKGAALTTPADAFVAEKLHTYALYYYKKKTAEGRQRFLKVGLFAVEQFPQQIYAYNDVAAVHMDGGETKKAREWLEKANRVNPEDTLVLMNLAEACLRLKDKAAARKWFEEVVRLEPNGEYTAPAKEALAKIESRK